MVDTYEMIFDSERFGADCVVTLQALSAQNAVDMLRRLYNHEIKVRAVKKQCEDWE